MCGEKQRRRCAIAGAAEAGAEIRSALVLLAGADDFGLDKAADAREFSIDIGCLLGHGLETSDLRWLVRMGYLEHAREITRPADATRRFQSSPNLGFTKRSFFVLTEAGLLVARRELARLAVVALAATAPADQPLLPDWDCERHILSLGGRVVKHFKHPSGNQKAVLDAFEEERWTHRILDPLPYLPQREAKKRLRSTINRLNRNQREPLLHFCGDGTGEAFCWKLTEAACACGPAETNRNNVLATA